MKPERKNQKQRKLQQKEDHFASDPEMMGMRVLNEGFRVTINNRMGVTNTKTTQKLSLGDLRGIVAGSSGC